MHAWPVILRAVEVCVLFAGEHFWARGSKLVVARSEKAFCFVLIGLFCDFVCRMALQIKDMAENILDSLKSRYT